MVSESSTSNLQHADVAVTDSGAFQMPDLRSPIFFLIWLARGDLRRVVAGSVYSTLWMVSLALPTYVLSRAIDAFLGGSSTGRLALWALAVFAAGAISAWLAIARHRNMSLLRIRGNFRLSRVIVRHATRLGTTLARRVEAGQLSALGLGDVAGASTSLTVTGPGFGAVIAYMVIGVLLLQVSGLLALVILLGVPVLVVVVGPIMGRLIESQDSYRTEQGTLTAQLIDAMDGLRVLNALGGKARYKRRFDDTSGRLLKRGYEVAEVSSWVSAVALGLPAVFLASVTWLSARLVVQDAITPGELVAVYGYTAALVQPVTALIEGGDMLGRGVVAARRIIAFLSLAPVEITDGDESDLPWRTATLYDPQSGVMVAPEAFVGLVSDSTAEAASIVNRLGGVEPGFATWGDRDVAACPSASLRARVLVADADSAIFAGTVGELVRGSRRAATDAELRSAIDVAGAEDAVTALGDGLDGWINTGGSNLSGGQRQRLRLARAVLQHPEVLLAYEPTSALDAHTEAVVADRLHRVRQGLQTLVASTSPLMLSKADTVFFVMDGEVVAVGTHAELLADKRYRRLVSRGDVTKPQEMT